MPTLILHGTKDTVVPHSHGQKFAAAVPGATLVTFQDGGHMLNGREVVKANHLIRDFVLGRPVESRIVPPSVERKAPGPRRRTERRVLWLSSPHRPRATSSATSRCAGRSARPTPT